jgi:hypothetical protein
MLRIIAVASIIALAAPAYAGVIFNSLDSPNTTTANDNSEPMFATFSTGAAGVLRDVSLLLSSPIRLGLTTRSSSKLEAESLCPALVMIPAVG